MNSVQMQTVSFQLFSKTTFVHSFSIIDEEIKMVQQILDTTLKLSMGRGCSVTTQNSLNFLH